MLALLPREFVACVFMLRERYIDNPLVGLFLRLPDGSVRVLRVWGKRRGRRAVVA